MTNDRWTPVRRGERYCSPACGGGCTFAAFEEATKAACNLLAECSTLPGTWRFRVWENLGWHFSVNNGNGISIHPNMRGDFTAFINFGAVVDSGLWTARGTTPREALQNAADVDGAAANAYCTMLALKQLRETIETSP